MNAGGGAVDGSAFAPAVLAGVTSEMRLFHEEQFGPVVPIGRYVDDQEVIDALVASPFGQQISLFGADPTRLGHFIDACAHQVGRINLNTQCQRGPDSFPFNGRKDSAEGTLSIHDALRVFSIRSLVATKLTATNKQIVREILNDHRSSFLSTEFIL